MQIFCFAEFFFRQCQQIRFDLTCFFIIDTNDFLDTGVCHFFHIIGQFDLGYKIAVFIFFCRQFINAAKGRAVIGSNQLCTNPPQADGGTLQFQAGDEVFIQITGCGDQRIGIACLIQHLSCTFGQICQVTAVQTDTKAFFRQNPLFFHFIEYLNGMGYPAFQCIICVHQQDTCIGEQICISTECCQFIRETHNPAVGMGAFYGNIVQLACQHITCGCTACDHGCSCTQCTCIGALRTAQPKFQNRVALRCMHHAGSLCGDQALVVDDIQKGCFDQLCFDNWCFDPHQRFMGKYHSPFGNRIHFACKTKILQITDEALGKDI